MLCVAANGAFLLTERQLTEATGGCQPNGQISGWQLGRPLLSSTPVKGFGILPGIGLLLAARLAAAGLFSQPFDERTTLIEIQPFTAHGLFRQFESITIRATNLAPLHVFSWTGQTMYRGSEITVTNLPVGHYFVECHGDRAQFAVLPADYRGGEFLGTEAHGRHGPADPAAQRAERLAPHYVRVMGEGYWKRVQPEPDTWNWSDLDKVVNANAGRRIIVMAFLRPDWQKSDAGFIPLYSRYVGEMARRYQDRIYGIQIWNEPWFGLKVPWFMRLPGRTEAEFVSHYTDLVRAARTAIKEAAPNIAVIGPSWDGNQQHYPLGTTRHAVAAGVPDLIDIWSWHDDNWGAPPDGKSDVLPIHRRLEIIRGYVGNKPLLITEGKIPGQSALGAGQGRSRAHHDANWKSQLDWRAAMARIIKTTVMYHAGGVRAYLPHVLALGAPPPLPNLEMYGWDTGPTLARLRGPHPKTTAFLMMCHWLNGATPTRTLIRAENHFLYEYSQPGRDPFVIGWQLHRQAALPASFTGKVTDVYGQAVQPPVLSAMPVFLHNTTIPDLAAGLGL